MRLSALRKSLVPFALLLVVAPEAYAALRRPVQFKTGDGTMLSGTFYDSRAVGPGTLFLLDCDGNPQELVNLAGKITAAGPRVLIWDYRKGANPNTNFSQAAEDANAAWKYLSVQPRVGSDEISILAIGCGARLAIPFAAKTGKVKLMVLLSPDLTGVSDQDLAAVSKLPLEIYGNGDEEGAKRLFAMNTNEQTQTKLYRRKEKGMDLYRADRTVREGIDVYFQLVYGAWSADDF